MGIPTIDTAVLEGSLGEGLVEAKSQSGVTRWQHFKLLIRESLLLKVGVVIVFAAVFLAIFGPIIAPKSTTNATGLPLTAPNGKNWFGTDSSGLDVFSRVLASPRIDVTIAVVSTLISFIVGSMIGLLASTSRGWLGTLSMRASDAFQAAPLFVLAVVFVVTAGRSTTNVVIVISALQCPIYLRLIRGQVLSLRERTFVETARANGDRPLSVAVRHILPNALNPAFAQAPITFGFAILIAAGLSFIGAGVQPPTPEWGAMISSGRSDLILGTWWTTVFPGAALSVTVFGFAVVGSAVQTVFDRKG
jgi:peptide/nickel transport system permease protein